MHRNRTAILLIGVFVCTPLLILYYFGAFVDAAHWLRSLLPSFLVLPEGELYFSRVLQMCLYTFLAFSSAWIGLELEDAWKKYFFLLGLLFLLCLLTPILALNGILFEPFSSSLAAASALLLGVIVGDKPSALTPPISAVQEDPSGGVDVTA